MFDDKEKDGKKKKKQIWTEEQEKLLASWSEKASGYRWLHMRSEKLYRKRNYAFTIPVIILSTLTGTANFAMDSFVPEEHKQIAMACVGGVNIFAGILSTLQNFLRYAELMEGHRVAEVSWSKFSREISVELALEPDMRKPAFDFLTVCRAEFDRLIEQSPTIDDSIIAQYNAKFMKKKKIKKSSKGIENTTSVDINGSPRSVISDGGHNEDDIDHPHVCNGIHKCNIYKPKPEDKLHETVAMAGGKFMENKFNKKWSLDKIHDKVSEIPKASVKNTAINFENRQELEGLKNIGKVKSFKEKINKEEVEDHPAKEIKKIVKAIKEDSLEEEEEEETIVNLTSSEMMRTTLDDEDKEMLLNSIKEPPTETNPEEIIIGDFQEEEQLLPKVSEPQPEPEVVETLVEIVDDIESNTKETQTEKEENKGDIVIDVEEEKSESNDEHDLFKEENEIKDFLEKIE